MGTCKFDGCEKKEFREGLCTVHMKKKPAAAAAVPTLFLARAKGLKTVHAQFQALAASTSNSEPYANRIEHLMSSGPVSQGGAESVHGVLCLHDTQSANNCTVWYSWDNNQMTVWGLGSHSGGSGAGNDKYSMVWFDGTNKSWTRNKKKKKK